MSDVGSDLAAVEEMVDAAIERLVVRDRTNELIHFVFIENGKQQAEAWQAILRRFSKDPNQTGNVRGVMECAYAMTRYLIALEIALGERQESNVAVPQYPHNISNDSFWDDIPF